MFNLKEKKMFFNNSVCLAEDVKGLAVRDGTGGTRDISVKTTYVDAGF